MKIVFNGTQVVVRSKYKKISEENGAEIKGVYYISRDEPFPSFYEKADFSLNTIKTSIRDGELNTNKVLKDGCRARSLRV
jgi:hypothetical protein